MPLEEHLLRAWALRLFEAGAVTMAQGAKLVGLSLEEFIEVLGQAGVEAVSYPPEDLEEEIQIASGLPRSVVPPGN